MENWLNNCCIHLKGRNLSSKVSLQGCPDMLQLGINTNALVSGLQKMGILLVVRSYNKQIESPLLQSQQESLPPSVSSQVLLVLAVQPALRV